MSIGLNSIVDSINKAANITNEESATSSDKTNDDPAISSAVATSIENENRVSNLYNN